MGVCDYSKTHVGLEVWLVKHWEYLETVEDQERIKILRLKCYYYCFLQWFVGH